jgi:anti-sigma B factor antagonist
MTSIELSKARALSAPGFAIAVSRAGGTCFLAVSGELDMATGPQLRATLDAESDGGAPIVVDLASLDFIDITGLRVLLDAADQATAKGHDFEVRNPSAPVRRLLELTGLGGALPIRRD